MEVSLIMATTSSLSRSQLQLRDFAQTAPEEAVVAAARVLSAASEQRSLAPFIAHVLIIVVDVAER